MDLSNQIKQRRTQRGFSQEDLAEKIYVSRQIISNWETDKTYPDVQSLLLLSILFDTTIDELIKGDMEAMEEAVAKDYKIMQILSWGGFAVAILGVVLFFGGITYWEWDTVPSALIALLTYGIGMTMLIKVERLKKQHDIVTYQELIAFSKGEPINRDSPRSQRARQHRILKVVITTLIAALVGGILGYLAYATGLIGEW
ncbi:MAG: helix-turn-helix transcriptional regulator [Gordonibacter sp.]|nr:helix-turn-helix transcriptional regulator [Gordonibacter sp.]